MPQVSTHIARFPDIDVPEQRSSIFPVTSCHQCQVDCRAMRQELIVVAIAFIATCDIGVDAYFSKILTKSKPSVLFGQKEIIDRINAQWSPHMILGEEKMEAFALISQQEEDAKKAEIAEKEAAVAAEVAKVAAVEMANKQKEAAIVAAAAAASAAESARVSAVALAKKEEEAKAVAAAASAAESARAAAVALAKKEEEELEEAAEMAMVVAAAVAKEAADEEAAQVLRVKKQEELSRLAEVASKANAIEKAESEKSSTTVSSSSSPSNPIQLQEMLVGKKKTASEQLLSATGVSASVSDDIDIFDVMQASAEAEAAQVSVRSMLRRSLSLHDF